MPLGPRVDHCRRRTVEICPWFAKARTKHRAGQLEPEHERLVAALFNVHWTSEDPAPAFV
ncbi:hypothetical protein HW130_25220 [Streptomyces sp. PKU-EA00015]|uniref:hypothetical protein n=1 Tax=Streptomyces sp. PKU-EA00015 TaxID=2748326 RepID=UPI0015A1D733|nr:hypothetical protein [Streptomyces sp. PKU-EA00015]NWF29515.1 hypothetical protein [Streptomyces sp. PKU-EA00015]